MKFGDLINYLDEAFPKSLSAAWDNDGVEVCVDYNLEIGRILTVLDITFDAVDYAVTNGYNCILSHHPMIFSPLKKLDLTSPASKKAVTLIRHDICAASFHTRLDSVDGGVNDCLLKALDITGAAENIELLTDPDDNNIPVGRVVTLTGEEDINDFINDIKKSLRKFYKKEFMCDSEARIGYLNGSGKVKKIGVVSGSGMDFTGIAGKMGADTFITGEGKYHDILDEYESSYLNLNNGDRLNIITAGHFETEIVVLPFIKQKILEKFPSASVDCFIGIGEDGNI